MDNIEYLYQLVSESRVDDAIEQAENILARTEENDFKKVIGRNLFHLSNSLVSFIDKFYNEAKKEIKVKAIYGEMNGFTINYDSWYIDLFAYTYFESLEDLDWLTDFEFSSETSMIMKGFEDIQEIFKDYDVNEKWNDKKLKEASMVCEHRIILRLQELFREAKRIAVEKNLKWKKIPIFSTAHDYDMVYKS